MKSGAPEAGLFCPVLGLEEATAEAACKSTKLLFVVVGALEVTVEAAADVDDAGLVERLDGVLGTRALASLFFSLPFCFCW